METRSYRTMGRKGDGELGGGDGEYRGRWILAAWRCVVRKDAYNVEEERRYRGARDKF